MSRRAKDLVACGAKLLHSSFNTYTRTKSTHAIKKQFDVGVLGAGRISRLHIPNVLQNRRFAIKWIVDDNMESMASVQEDFNLHDVPTHKSEEVTRLLEDSSLDAVLIFSSTPTHTPLTCQALEAGKGVFVEKPVGESREDIQKCFQTAEKSGKPLLVGFNRRFDPTMMEAYRHVSNGAVGTIQFFRFTTRDSPKPSYEFLKSCDSTGCNILADLSVHDVDQLVWLTHAERPEHVYVTTHAHDSTMAEFGEADAVAMLIKYKSGAIASFDGFRDSCYGYDIRMEIFGSDGMVSANNPRETSTYVDLSSGGQENRLHLSFPQRFQESYKVELDHFADCLEGKTTPSITKEQNLLVAEIIEKGLQSFKEGKPAYFE